MTLGIGRPPNIKARALGGVVSAAIAALEIAFNCIRCPVSAFFKIHGASDLCVLKWCALGYPLALKWGSHLERKGTIAMRKDHCDFRWHVDQSEPTKQNNDEADT